MHKNGFLYVNNQWYLSFQYKPHPSPTKYMTNNAEKNTNKLMFWFFFFYFNFTYLLAEHHSFN